jgi:hypothetical protein
MTINTHRIQAVAVAAITTLALALPSASQAVDSTTSSSWYCAWATTPWLAYSPLAGYKCFQYSNNTGLSSAATRRY